MQRLSPDLLGMVGYLDRGDCRYHCQVECDLSLSAAGVGTFRRGLERRRDDVQFRLYLGDPFSEEARRLDRWMTILVRVERGFRCCKKRCWRGVSVGLRVVQVGVLDGRGVVFGDLDGAGLGDAGFDGVAELDEVLMR